MGVEYFDVLDSDGNKTGHTKARNEVHRDGDWHRAVHVWVYIMSTKQLLIQQRASCKESWPNLWDISAAGHVSSGEKSLDTAKNELHEELGIELPKQAFEFLYTYKQQCVTNDGQFLNNEFDDVYLVSIKDPLPLNAFELQIDEVQKVRYIDVNDLEQRYTAKDPTFVSDVVDMEGEAGRLFKILKNRGKEGNLPGSGIGSQMVQLEDGGQIEMQYLLFDEHYLKLVPPEHR